MIGYICTKAAIHNGVSYRPGQRWDGDLPAPCQGTSWTIDQHRERDFGQEVDGIVTSSSRGFVQWAPRPGRRQPPPLTAREKEILAANPYADIDGIDSPAREMPEEPSQESLHCPAAPVMSSHVGMSEEERSDPFGIGHRDDAGA
jgi:hypothetical protein